MPRFAAAFLQQPDILDVHSAINRFAHVVHRQQGDSGRCQCFHFYAGSPHGFGCDCAVNRRRATVGFKFDSYPGQRDRMAKRDEFGGAFGPLNGRDACHAQNIAFLGTAFEYPLKCRRQHTDGAAGNGHPVRLGFFSDIDHVGLALRVEMREFVQGSPQENMAFHDRTLLSLVYHITVKLLAFSLILSLVAAPLAAQQLPDLGDASEAVLSQLQERRFGEAIMRQIRSSPDFMNDPEVTDYLNRVGFALVANSPDPGGHFEFFAVNSMVVNAFALPGGFIGVHSGLILTAQSESELVGVIGHEIAHVTQRHIARMLAAQKKTGLASLAAIAVAILAASSSPELAQAAILAAQAVPMQSRLNYSRDHEREADRVGLQIVQKSHYDVHAIPMFFERLQRASRVYEGGAPSYLRTHPMTFERIADIQSRTRDIPFRQVPDSLEFQLVRSRLVALNGQPADAVANFTRRIEEKKHSNELASRYGLVVATLRVEQLKTRDLETADVHVESLLKDAGDDPMVLALAANLDIRAGRTQSGLDAYQRALISFPTRRSLMYGYATTLLDSGQNRMAVEFLERSIMRAQPDPRLYELQARGHASLGERMAQHRALAEASLLRGNLAAAIEQLRLAKLSGDGDFYDQSSVDARLKELMGLDAELRERADTN